MSSSGDAPVGIHASDDDFQYYADLLEEQTVDSTSTDEGIALFLLVANSVLLVVFSFVMMIFFQKRNVFEIRARSPTLVMLTGACAMVVLALSIMLQRVVLFDDPLDVVPYICIHYFVLACVTCCYGSRTIRLAVMYNARARKAVPWLMSERNHVVICLLLGMAALAFPLYDLYEIPDGPFADLVFLARSDETLWRVNIGSQAVAAALWVYNRKIDDIFSIAWEIKVGTVWHLLVTAAGKLGENHLRAPYNRWFDSDKFGIFVVLIVFSVSVGNPLRQLLFNPMESTNPKVAEALAKRKEGAATVAMRDGEASPASVVFDEDVVADLLADASNVMWTYEKVAKNPPVSAAFDDFAQKALCQESVLFLKAVASFQSGSDDQWEASPGGSGTGSNDDNYAAFTQIVVDYIMSGAPNEVNLSSVDKSAILRVYEAGRSGFFGLADRERRFVFARAYAEVRYMLETNLMLKFVSSEGFKVAQQQ